MIPSTLGMRSAFAAAVALSIPLAAYAQAPAVTKSSTSAAADETIQLSPFEVKDTPNRGYVSSESMTGSRVAVKIIDLPYTVNVLTSEFFEDFGLFELGDNLTQVGGFTGLDIGGNFNLRGFSATSQLRDGFYRLGRYGSSNIDRMEIIKGSNAAIYGRTSPGGMINMISKQPKSKESQELSLMFGDYNQRRGVLETTGPLFKGSLGTTNYIVTASQFVRGFDQKGENYAVNRNNEAYLALKHTFPDNSSLFFSAEYFHQTRNAPTSAAPLVIDQKGTTAPEDDEAIGYAKPLADYNAHGPTAELNRGNIAITAVYEKSLSSIFSTRVAGNYYRARRWDYNQNNSWGTININPVSGAAPTSARGGTPSKGLIFEDGGGFQSDLLARYKLFGDRVENQTLVTIDINDYYRYDPSWDYAQRGGTGNARIVNGVITVRTDPVLLAWDNVRTVTLNPDLTPRSAIGYFPDRFKWGKEYNTRNTYRRTTSYGGLLRQQSAFLNNRLLTFAGFRFDRVQFRHRDFTSEVSAFPAIPGYIKGQKVERTVNELKPNFGVNYKLTGNLRTFVNYSESYFVNQQDTVPVIAEADYKSEVADGWDYGFKGEFFDGKLTFTASGFYANRNNVRVNTLVETPAGYITVNQRDGDQLVRGAELDVNWLITDAWSTTLSYGHVNSRYTDFGTASPLAVGRRVQGISPYNGGASVKWAPTTGAFKNFSINLGVTHVSDTPTEAPNAGDNYVTVGNQRVLTRTTKQWALENPAFTIWDLGMRYTLKGTGSNRIDHTFAVNLKNLTDEDYLRVNQQSGERFGAYFTYTIGRFGE